MRNPYLTKGMEKVLRIMDTEEEELVFEKGAGWWVGEHKTSGKVGLRLLRFCLVKEDGFPGQMLRLYINGDGKKALTDPLFVPPIVEVLKNTN